MCFSPTVSFATGGALTVAGIVTLRKSKSKAEWLLASVPLLFGLQQIAEGFVWLCLDRATTCGTLSTYSYLSFANVLWPALIPIAILLVERDVFRKKMLYVLSAIGVGTSLYMLALLVLTPFSSRIVGQSIAYHTEHGYPYVIMWSYVVATCVSGWVSSHRWLRALGVAVFLSLGVAYIFFTYALPSVWCFFSAIMSLLIYEHVTRHEATNTNRHRQQRGRGRGLLAHFS